MATKAAHKRLTREYKNIQENPTPYIMAHPNENHILEWHYLITGPPDTPYEGGQYHGTLVFPSDYPFKPPAIRMITPSGRFKTNTRLCLSISDYHPKTWNPAWSVSTILTGLLSFMVSDETTAGSITSSEDQKRQFAKQSYSWNLSNPQFLEHFSDLVDENREQIRVAHQENKKSAEKKSLSSSSSSEKEDGSTETNPTAPVPATSGFSSTQKAICVFIIFVSWVLASRLLSSINMK